MQHDSPGTHNVSHFQKNHKPKAIYRLVVARHDARWLVPSIEPHEPHINLIPRRCNVLRVSLLPKFGKTGQDI
jgi:hypothetical protein